jgi:hypothetical protein
MSIVKSKSVGIKKRMVNPKSGVHFVKTRRTDAKFRSREQRLNLLLRRLKSPIDLLAGYIAEEPLSKPEKLSLLSLLNTLNLQRDTLERMKENMSETDHAMISEHLFNKMQSSFSEVRSKTD